MMDMDRERTWRHIVLGESWETNNPEDRAAFLESLENDAAAGPRGIWFDGATDDDDDDQLVTDILEAIHRNPNISGVCLQNMEYKVPMDWLHSMLTGDKIQELRMMRGNEIGLEDAATLLHGISNSTSLKVLCVDFPSITLLGILNLALKSEVLQLETLDIAGFMNDAYTILAPVLRYCNSLKKLVLTMGRNVILDGSIDELVQALERGTPKLEQFSFGFGYASPAAFSKLANALATKNLNFLSFGTSEEQVVLDDPSPLERLIAGNRQLEFFNIQNVETADMSGMFLALNHDNLKKIMLTNVIKTRENARDLGMSLARNNTPLETLEIWSMYENFEHEPFLSTLSDGLCNSTTLKSVTCHLKKVCNDDLNALAVVLEANPRLKRMKVTQNSQTPHARDVDSGVLQLGQALGRNHGLERLDLTLDCDVSERATRAVLDGVKGNSTLKHVAVDWFSEKQQAELDFYIKLNLGPKQALYSPLNLMAYAFARADQCRLGGDSPQRIFGFADLLEQANDATEATEGFLEFMTALMLAGDPQHRQEGELLPPSVLYYFIRERCDLFGEAAEVARRKQRLEEESRTSWCCGWWRNSSS